MKKDFILAVDIGNSSVSLGLVRGERVVARGCVPSGTLRAAEIEGAIAVVQGGRPVVGAALSSVVPGRTAVWQRALVRCMGRPPLEVSHRIRLGIRVSYPKPETIGVDRLVNAVEATARYGAPVIVADFGTASTFDVICPLRGFVGGVIAPGWPLMLDYLAERTALLPRLAFRRPRRVTGRSTTEAMRSGAHWGYLGLVREILDSLRAEWGLDTIRIVATGGYAVRSLVSDMPQVILDRDLTLRGLARLYGLNQSECPIEAPL